MASTTVNHINRELAEECVKEIEAISAALKASAEVSR